MELLLILTIGFPLAIWLHIISERAIEKDRKEAAKKLKMEEDKKFREGECICEYLNRNGGSGYCSKHRTMWA